MSRRTIPVLLAAAAALTATHAAADPECFGGSCRLPDVIETPPPVVAPARDPAPDIVRNPVGSEAFAQAPRAVIVRRPRPVAEPEPVITRTPVRFIDRDIEPPVVRVTEPRAPEPQRPPARTYRARVVQGQIDPGPLVGYPLTTGSVVVGAPSVIYGGFVGRPVYLVAPSAKIIQLDSAE